MNADTLAGTVWHVTMSLDGYIAGPDDTMDWAHGHGPAGLGGGGDPGHNRRHSRRTPVARRGDGTLRTRWPAG